MGRHFSTPVILRGRRRLAPALLMLVAAAGAGPAALAQDREPSGSELREAYPLRQGTPAETDSGAAPTPAATDAPSPAPPSGDGSAAVGPLVAAGLVLAAFLIGFALRLRPLRRRLRRAPPDRRAPATMPGDAGGPSRDTLRPPVPRRRWTAEIEWHADDGAARFLIVAEDGDAARTVLGESPAGEWPPSGPEDVAAMRAAADELETRMIAAGWRSLPPGDAWYAKRYAWEPGAATASRARRFRPSGQANHAEPSASRGGRRP